MLLHPRQYTCPGLAPSARAAHMERAGTARPACAQPGGCASGRHLRSHGQLEAVRPLGAFPRERPASVAGTSHLFLELPLGDPFRLHPLLRRSSAARVTYPLVAGMVRERVGGSFRKPTHYGWAFRTPEPRAPPSEAAGLGDHGGLLGSRHFGETWLGRLRQHPGRGRTFGGSAGLRGLPLPWPRSFADPPAARGRRGCPHCL